MEGGMEGGMVDGSSEASETMEADHLRMQSRKGKERLQTRARRRLHSPPPRFLAMEACGLGVGHRWPGCKQLWNRQSWWRPKVWPPQHEPANIYRRLCSQLWDCGP